MLYMLYLARGEHQTSFYAICTGFMTLGLILPGSLAGYPLEWLGYTGFFVWILVATIPSFRGDLDGVPANGSAIRSTREARMRLPTDSLPEAFGTVAARKARAADLRANRLEPAADSDGGRGRATRCDVAGALSRRRVAACSMADHGHENRSIGCRKSPRCRCSWRPISSAASGSKSAATRCFRMRWRLNSWGARRRWPSREFADRARARGTIGRHSHFVRAGGRCEHEPPKPDHRHAGVQRKRGPRGGVGGRLCDGGGGGRAADHGQALSRTRRHASGFARFAAQRAALARAIGGLRAGAVSSRDRSRLFAGDDRARRLSGDRPKRRYRPPFRGRF